MSAAVEASAGCAGAPESPRGPAAGLQPPRTGSRISGAPPPSSATAAAPTSPARSLASLSPGPRPTAGVPPCCPQPISFCARSRHPAWGRGVPQRTLTRNCTKRQPEQSHHPLARNGGYIAHALRRGTCGMGLWPMITPRRFGVPHGSSAFITGLPASSLQVSALAARDPK